MKKIISLLLVTILCVSLCACGGSKDGADTSKENEVLQGQGKEYNLGETIKTENWEITLTKVTFGTNLCKESESKDYMIVDGDYEKTITWQGETMNLAYVAEEGRAFVSLAYTMKYVGKEAVNVNGWPVMKVDYNGGYIFEEAPYIDGCLHIWNGEKFEEVDFYEIEPLSPEAEYRDCFDVPLEVKENTEGTVNIIIDLGKDGTHTYKVR